MGPVTGVVTYVIIWWTVFFAVLPLGVRSQLEDGDVAPGSEPGAPARPDLRRKVALTSAVSAGVWVIVFAIVASGVIPTP